MYPNTLRIVAATIAVLLVTPAAEGRPHQVRHQPPGWVDVAAIPAYPIAQRGHSRPHRAIPRARGHRAAAQERRTPPAAQTAEPMLADKPQLYVKPSSPSEKLVTIQEYKRSVCRGWRGSTSLARVVEPLKSKAQEIVRACGAIIVSTDCRGGATPNHRNGLAVDVRMPGNKSPACIYAHLQGWPGGVSTDYWNAPGVRHVHFSYSRKHEWGLRFAHSRYGKRARYAAGGG